MLQIRNVSLRRGDRELFDTINVTEGRAAEHTAQRGSGAEASVEEALAGLEHDGDSTADDDGSPRPGSRSGKPKKRRKRRRKR